MLLNREPSSANPIYLEVDASSSLLGRLADSNIYLSQVGSSQATFILFPDEGNDANVGWVFPNPALVFKEPALKDVFPTLTEAQFNGAKEQIEPVRLRQVGERRWKVDRSM
jgi:hypothetical protein